MTRASNQATDKPLILTPSLSGVNSIIRFPSNVVKSLVGKTLKQIKGNRPATYLARMSKAAQHKHRTRARLAALVESRVGQAKKYRKQQFSQVGTSTPRDRKPGRGENVIKGKSCHGYQTS